MKKIIIWSVVGILILGICAVGIWSMRQPQVIQLDKNTKLTLLGVEYGKHHKFPKIKTTGRRTGGGPSSFDTTNDTLIVWILQETKGQNRYSWQALVSDTAETASVLTWATRWNNIGANRQIAAVQLDAFPRWERKFFMRFSSWGPQGERAAKGHLVISNPARKTSFPRWANEPIPNAQSDGDLNVTLTKFVYGVPGFNNAGPAKDPANKAVQVEFHVEQNGVVATNWQPFRIEASDASGNRIENRSWSSSHDQNGDAMMTFQPSLWPAQTPWKLHVEMSRLSGFKDGEIWNISNLPVNAGGQQELWNYGRNTRAASAFSETTLNDIHLQIFPALQFTNQPGGNGEKRGGFRIVADRDPVADGFRMTLVDVTDENGRPLQFWNGGYGGGNYTFQLPNLRNAQSLNLTIALHKSRFIEFTATPTKQ